jgi:hypothetical protein
MRSLGYRGILVTIAAVSLVVVASGRAASATPSSPVDQPVPSSIGIRLLDAPANAQDDPRAQVHIVDHLAPGTTIRRRIEVSTTSPVPVHATLYAAAASITGGSFIGADGHTPNDVSTWTSVSPGEVDIPAGGQVIATVTVAVPKDAAPGEQYGVVWAEARSAPAGAAGIVQVTRVGIRLYLSVGPGGPPAADFTIQSLTAKRSPDGSPMVLAAVHNTGGRALDLVGTLELSAGPGGVRAGPFPATLGTSLAVGDTEPVTIVLDKALPAGPWNATVTLRSGLIERTANATISFPVTGSAPPVATASSGGSPLGLALAALVLVLALGAGVAIWRWLTRGRRLQRVPVASPR